MFDFLVTADGGLTTAGYAVCIIAGILLFVAAIAFAGKVSEKKRMGTKQLVFCAVTMALAFVTSYLKIFEMPWGGSVTLCSMLFIVLAANWYGEDGSARGACIRDPSVPSGAVRAFLLPGVL